VVLDMTERRLQQGRPHTLQNHLSLLRKSARQRPAALPAQEAEIDGGGSPLRGPCDGRASDREDANAACRAPAPKNGCRNDGRLRMSTIG
jgi:hypothetical protein